jgi:hypothetical protein
MAKDLKRLEESFIKKFSKNRAGEGMINLSKLGFFSWKKGVFHYNLTSFLTKQWKLKIVNEKIKDGKLKSVNLPPKTSRNQGSLFFMLEKKG